MGFRPTVKHLHSEGRNTILLLGSGLTHKQSFLALAHVLQRMASSIIPVNWKQKYRVPSGLFKATQLQLECLSVVLPILLLKRKTTAMEYL